MLASTVAHGSSAKSWNTKVSGLRLPGGGAPRHCALPALGCSSPPRIDSSVLLPHPEGPTIATTSPGPTVNDTSSSTSSAPKRWLMRSAIRSIDYSVSKLPCQIHQLRRLCEERTRRSNPFFSLLH